MSKKFKSKDHSSFQEDEGLFSDNYDELSFHANQDQPKEPKVAA